MDEADCRCGKPWFGCPINHQTRHCRNLDFAQVAIGHGPELALHHTVTFLHDFLTFAQAHRASSSHFGLSFALKHTSGLRTSSSILWTDA